MLFGKCHVFLNLLTCMLIAYIVFWQFLPLKTIYLDSPFQTSTGNILSASQVPSILNSATNLKIK